MGSININFADVEGSFDAMPEGRYPVIIEKVEVRESKSSDNNYFNWELTITEGEFEGRKLWMITSLSPKALFRLKDVYEALGVLEDEMDLQWDDDVEITPQAGPLVLHPDVVGLPAIAIVGIEPYDGKDRNRVNDLVSPDDAPAQRQPGASARTSAKPKASAGRRALR